ncbi:iron chelate uptake ABC transporter family permease subunit [Shigella boydii]
MAQAASSPDINVIEQMIFHYSLLPRLAISLRWARLGLVGVLFRQVVRNPLAEPTTSALLRRATGDYRHHALGDPRRYGEPVCCAGRVCVVGLIVFGVAWGRRLSPVTLILAGLVVSLYCGNQ